MSHLTVLGQLPVFFFALSRRAFLMVLYCSLLPPVQAHIAPADSYLAYLAETLSTFLSMKFIPAALVKKDEPLLTPHTWG